jgi:hypothetical protein
MAIKKATTTEDFVEEKPSEEVPVEAPKETEAVTDEVAVSASEPEQEAVPVADGYAVLVGPAGSETTVPDSILEALLDSGYKKK